MGDIGLAVGRGRAPRAARFGRNGRDRGAADHRRRSRAGFAATAAAALVAATSLGATAVPSAATVPATDDALAWINLTRATADQKSVGDNPTLAAGAAAHSSWILANGVATHSECTDDTCATPITVPLLGGGTGPAVGSTVAGHKAARNGNIVASWKAMDRHEVVESWLTSPFHAVNLLSPKLATVGFGDASDPQAPGVLKYAATLDVLSDLSAPATAATFPVAWPANGAVVSATSYNGNELPNPLTACPGRTAPTGPPLVVMLGDHLVDPSVAPPLSKASFGRVDPDNPTVVTPLPFCAFDGTGGPFGYTNPNTAHQGIGRSVLAPYAAAVVLPDAPLEVGSRYRFTVETSGQRVQSTFTVGELEDTAAPPPLRFSDVGRYHPFLDAITWMVDEGLTTGFADGTFGPGLPVTRKSMAAFLWRLNGRPNVDCPTEMPDVGPDHPFRAAICWMLAEGITTGYADGAYRPEYPLTRQTAAAFLHRMAGLPAPANGDPGFPDVPADHPFRTAVAWAVEQGITEGYSDGTFRGGATLSRQAVAAFLFRAEHSS